MDQRWGMLSPNRADRAARGLGGDRVAPGAEGGEGATPVVQGEVSVHHAGHADGAHGRQLHAAGGAQVLRQGGVGGAQAGLDLVDGVGPHAVDQAVVPGVAAGGQDGAGRVGQDGLDAGGAEFDAEGGAGQVNAGGVLGSLRGSSGCSIARRWAARPTAVVPGGGDFRRSAPETESGRAPAPRRSCHGAGPIRGCETARGRGWCPRGWPLQWAPASTTPLAGPLRSSALHSDSCDCAAEGRGPECRSLCIFRRPRVTFPSILRITSAGLGERGRV